MGNQNTTRTKEKPGNNFASHRDELGIKESKHLLKAGEAAGPILQS